LTIAFKSEKRGQIYGKNLAGKLCRSSPEEVRKNPVYHPSGFFYRDGQALNGANK
jgi:hypothetical protein